MVVLWHPMQYKKLGKLFFGNTIKNKDFFSEKFVFNQNFILRWLPGFLTNVVFSTCLNEKAEQFNCCHLQTLKTNSLEGTNP